MRLPDRWLHSMYPRPCASVLAKMPHLVQQLKLGLAEWQSSTAILYDLTVFCRVQISEWNGGKIGSPTLHPLEFFPAILPGSYFAFDLLFLTEFGRSEVSAVSTCLSPQTKELMWVYVYLIIFGGTAEITTDMSSGPTVSQTWDRLPPFITWDSRILTLTGGSR